MYSSTETRFFAYLARWLRPMTRTTTRCTADLPFPHILALHAHQLLDTFLPGYLLRQTTHSGVLARSPDMLIVPVRTTFIRQITAYASLYPGTWLGR